MTKFLRIRYLHPSGNGGTAYLNIDRISFSDFDRASVEAGKDVPSSFLEDVQCIILSDGVTYFVPYTVKELYERVRAQLAGEK